MNAFILCNTAEKEYENRQQLKPIVLFNMKLTDDAYFYIAKPVPLMPIS